MLGFSSNCFRKIEARATVPPVMTLPTDSAQTPRRRQPPASARELYIIIMNFNRGILDKRKNALGGRRNTLKRLDSDKEIEENPRKFL
jgi:hypothetical protein